MKLLTDSTIPMEVCAERVLLRCFDGRHANVCCFVPLLVDTPLKELILSMFRDGSPPVVSCCRAKVKSLSGPKVAEVLHVPCWQLCFFSGYKL